MEGLQELLREMSARSFKRDQPRAETDNGLRPSRRGMEQLDILANVEAADRLLGDLEFSPSSLDQLQQGANPISVFASAMPLFTRQRGQKQVGRPPNSTANGGVGGGTFMRDALGPMSHEGGAIANTLQRGLSSEGMRSPTQKTPGYPGSQQRS